MANGLIMIGIILFLCCEIQLITGEASSVYVTIRGANVSDNGYIPFDLIGLGKNSDSVLCHTDDPACCDKDQDNPGNWYYPDGSAVQSYTNTAEQGDSSSFHSFARNRGSNPSVVRLYRIKNNFAHERGHFRCDIHDAAGNCHQLYVNILDIGAISISRHNLSNTANGEIILCSAEIFHNPLPENVSYPSFEWFFGPTNSSLQSDVTVSNVTQRGNSYYSSLQFSPLLPHHAGMYTCRLGGNERLAATIYVEASEDYQTTMAEDSILKKEQNRILVFGIISIGLVAIILAGAVVTLATLLLRKKLCVQLYTINDQYHLYDIMFRHPLSTTSTDSVEENKVPKVPVYEEIPLQGASEWNQYEKIDISRCPAYEASIITD